MSATLSPPPLAATPHLRDLLERERRAQQDRCESSCTCQGTGRDFDRGGTCPDCDGAAAHYDVIVQAAAKLWREWSVLDEELPGADVARHESEVLAMMRRELEYPYASEYETASVSRRMQLYVESAFAREWAALERVP